MAKYQLKENYDLEDFVNDFLIYYNNRKHSTTGIAPYHVMRNVDDEHLISKVKLKTEKSDRRYWGQLRSWKRPARKDFKPYPAPRKYWIHCLSTSKRTSEGFIKGEMER